MTQSVQATESARTDLCRFLSACYYEPSADFAEQHLFDSMLSAAASIHPELADHARKLGAAFSGRDLQDLLVDYTRLFLGPVRALAMPYGSVWLSGDSALMQDSTIAVRELYEQGGFEVGEDFADLPDHVAVELEFLYLLLFTRQQAALSGRRDDLAEIQLLYGRFLREHLGAWIGSFTDAVQTHAETAFYRELAAFTAHFVRMEMDALIPTAQPDRRDPK